MNGEFETPDVDEGGYPPARPEGRREPSAPAPVPAPAAPGVPVGADAGPEPPGDEQPPPDEAGDNATRLSGRDAVITALGAASAVGSVLVAPPWIVLVTLAIFAVVLASLIPMRRRLLIPAAIMLVISAGVVAQQTSQKSDASETSTPLSRRPARSSRSSSA